MKCPKCFEEMKVGEIAYVYKNNALFWAPKDFFKGKLCNLFTKRGAIKIFSKIVGYL